MSRVGKQIIEVPGGVTIEVKDSVAHIKGAKGELSVELKHGITLKQEENILHVERSSDERYERAAHGLVRSLISNAIEGVSKGFERKLIVEGVGFKSNVAGKTLKLSLGFSHDVNFAIPEDVEVTTENEFVTVSGIDKQRVGQIAAEIRALKKPEPYKGKGIRYEDEYIVRKAGKAAGGGD